MTANSREGQSRVVRECVERLKEGQLAPWKVEEDLTSTYDLESPDNFKAAAYYRQRFIEELTEECFDHIHIPEKPYKERYRCEKDKLIWELDIRDEMHSCALCGSPLKPLYQFSPQSRS